MPRRNFAQILKDADIKIYQEYQSLHSLAFDPGYDDDCLYQLADMYFDSMPFRGTAVDLADFNNRYGFVYDQLPSSDNLDDLLGL